MRHIQKGEEPAAFSQWKKKNPKKRYEDLKGDVKRDLKEHLLQEQKYLCCYCESKIEIENSHIEHVRPQSKCSKEDLNYNNLLISCGKKEHCEQYKKNKILPISPLEQNCSEKFIYSFSGKIEAKKSEHQDTINHLKLNYGKLVATRKRQIESFNNFFKTDPNTALSYFTDLLGEKDGQLHEFHSLILFRYNFYNEKA